MKYFKEEIQKFYDKLIKGEKFAFSKYADGEWMAMKNENGTPGNGEWVISEQTSKSSQLLRESFMFKDPGYYVGVSCPCCQGDNHYQMVRASGQPMSNLTFANLFVNANYPYYLDNFIPAFSKRDVVLVANKQSDIHALPFKVEFFYPVGYNAWVDNLSLVEDLKWTPFKDKLVLFSCGPFGNILAHNMWAVNKNNTYLDVGSTLDTWLKNDFKNKRWYAHGDNTYSQRVCEWGVHAITGSVLR